METEITTEPVTALAVIAKLTSAQLTAAFTTGGMDPLLENIRAQVRAIDTDISTPEGRKAIAALAYKVSRTKTFIEDRRVDLVAEQKREIAKVDAEGKKMRDALDELRDEVRKPLTDWEDADKKRIAGHELMITVMLEIIGARFDSLEKVEKARGVIDLAWDRNFEEFTKRASQAHDMVLIHLNNEMKRIADEAEAKAEQTRLKAERDEQARKDREAKVAEDARLKAEADAKRRADAIAEQTKQREEELERTAAEEKARLQREIDDAKEREAQAERDRIAAAKQAEKDRDAARLKAAHDREAERKRAEDEREQAVQAERKRNDDLRKAEEDKKVEAERLRLAREADVEHRREIHKKAYDALLLNVADLTSPQARNIVQAIAKGFIPGVSIQY